MLALVVILVLGAAAVGLYVATYNGAVSKRNQAENAWSQIDVQLKRKSSLIPNLLETVKGFMAHERELLVQVSEARAALVRAQNPREAAQADSGLRDALSTLFVMVDERYPEIKANEGFSHLREELISTENRIAYARQAYSDAVTRFHNSLDTFPGNVIVGGRFKRMELFEIADTDRQAADNLSIKF